MRIDENTSFVDGNVKVEKGQIIYNLRSDEEIPIQDAKKLCYYFAVAMRGKHNDSTIGEREVNQIFIDDFRGKYAEIDFRNKIIRDYRDKVRIVVDLDFSILPRGEWDKVDLGIQIIETSEIKYLSIKGVKAFSRTLLIEASRYDKNGEHNYTNHNGEKILVDYYALLGIDIQDEEKIDNVYDNKTEEFKAFDDLFNNRKVSGNVLGVISHNEFWCKKAYIPFNVRCNVNNFKYIYDNKDIYNETNLNIYKELPIYYVDINGNKCLGSRNAYYDKNVIDKTTGKNKIERWKVKANYSSKKNRYLIQYPIAMQENNYFIPSDKLYKLESIWHRKSHNQISLFD